MPAVRSHNENMRRYQRARRRPAQGLRTGRSSIGPPPRWSSTSTASRSTPTRLTTRLENPMTPYIDGKPVFDLCDAYRQRDDDRQYITFFEAKKRRDKVGRARQRLLMQ